LESREGSGRHAVLSPGTCCRPGKRPGPPVAVEGQTINSQRGDRRIQATGESPVLPWQEKTKKKTGASPDEAGQMTGRCRQAAGPVPVFSPRGCEAGLDGPTHEVLGGPLSAWARPAAVRTGEASGRAFGSPLRVCSGVETSKPPSQRLRRISPSPSPALQGWGR